jgi:glycosyltransferase involved in cell wall biosynthesis
MNKNITALIFTLNEERRLPFVYENLKDFCEIIVIDGGSTDGTKEFCLQKNIKYLLRPQDDPADEMTLGRLTWAFLNTPTEYVMQVYCAHFFPEQLLDKFSDVANLGHLDAVYCDVVIYRAGQVVHRPIIRRVASACMFYKKGIINFNGAKVHDELAIKFNQDSMIRLEGRDELSLHLFQDEDSISFISKTVKYAKTEAIQLHRMGIVNGIIKTIIAPFGRFLYAYFRLGSFLQGKKGFVYAFLNLQYDLTVQLHLWELNNSADRDNAIKDNSKVRNSLHKLLKLSK